MMTKLNLTSQPSLDGRHELDMTETRIVCFRNEHIIISTIVLTLCLFGLVGNGTVIWLLGFRIKRNPFSTFILNLAVADFGVLITVVLIATALIQLAQKEHIALALISALYSFLDIMYSTSQLLLIAISIDRCVAVLFPIWHRCHRPPKLSTIICVLIWVLSLTQLVIIMLVMHAGQDPLVQIIMNILICYPLMATSTLILFVKVCYKQHNCQRTKTLTLILLTLFFFLIFGIPVNLYGIMSYFYSLHGIIQNILIIFLSGKSNITISDGNTSETSLYLSMLLESLALLCIALNSSVNPVLYCLTGREKKEWFGAFRLKVALQRLFHDEEDQGQEEQPQVQTLPGSL